MFSDRKTIYSFTGPFGVPVEIGSSILFLAFIFIGFSSSSTEQFVWGLSVFAMLVGSIFLHELGHAWGALIQNVPVRRVFIFGGGGFCEQKRSASARESELIVAMGPIVNFTIWAVCSLIANGMWESYSQTNVAPAFFALWPYLNMLATINLALGIYNMLPVQPLDGGKLFQLFLRRIFTGLAATRITGFVGLIIAVLWIPAMVIFYLGTGWILFFIPSVRLHYRYLRAA